jgi:lysozyme
MTISEMGVKFIFSHEAFYPQMYNDPCGYATIGVGHLIHYSKVGTDPEAEARYKNGLTEAEGSTLLNEDLKITCEDINSMFGDINLNQAQFDALVSFGFNIGTSDKGLADSTVRWRIEIGAPPAKIKEAWLWWNKGYVNGVKVVLPGLVTRRAHEAELYCTGVYKDIDGKIIS